MSWATIGFSRTTLLHGVMSRDGIMQNILFLILMISVLQEGYGKIMQKMYYLIESINYLYYLELVNVCCIYRDAN
jgi:hypothetical protein